MERTKRDAGIIDKKQYAKRQAELSIPYVENVLEEILLAHQRECLQQLLTARRNVIAGPAHLTSMPAIPERTKEQIRHEFEEFKADLLEIEKETIRAYVVLLEKYLDVPIGFSPTSRPEKLLPSHELLRYKEAKKEAK